MGYHATQQISALLVGFPSPILTSKLDSVLVQNNVEILIYSYQNSALVHRIEQWSNALTVNMPKNAEAISKVIGDVSIPSLPDTPSRFEMDSEYVISTKYGQKLTKPSTEPLIQSVSSVDEIALLLQTDIETDDDLSFDVKESTDIEITNNVEEDWLDEAIDIRFDGKWRCLFAPDETINVIYSGPNGEQIDERYIRSLKIGDRVLFIHGQKKQSLYKLIISRINKNPAIEVHLKLIERWHEVDCAQLVDSKLSYYI